MKKICENCYYGDPLWSENEEDNFVNFDDMYNKAIKIGEPDEEGNQYIIQDHEEDYRGCYHTKMIYPKEDRCHCNKFKCVIFVGE